MKRDEKHPASVLRSALESWDPVRREGEPADDQVAALRRRVVAPAPASTVPRIVRWRPVLAAAAAAALALVLLHDAGPRSPGSRPAPAPDGPPRSVPADRLAAGETAGPDAALDGEGRAAARPQVESPRRAEAPPSAPGGEGGRAGGDAGDVDRPRHAPAGLERVAGDAGVAGRPRHAPAAVERVADVATLAIAPQADAAAPAADRHAAAGPPAEPGAAAAAQKIQIIAPGGTRIVWLVAATPDRPTDSFEEGT